MARRPRRLCGWLALGCAGMLLSEPGRAQDYQRLQRVYAGGTSATGEPIIYPTARPAEIRSVVVTLLPGEETGWHRHDVPLFAYILEGEVTVDYGPHGTRTYRPGVAFMEAMAAAHNGRNTGATPCQILAVFLGEQGAALTEQAPAPEHAPTRSP